MSQTAPTMQLVYALAMVATLTAAVTDARTGRIPNWLSLPLIVVGPLVHLLGSGGTAGLGSLLGIVTCAALPFLLFVKGAMGGGDVKLLAALGGLLGIQLGIEVQLASYLLLTLFVLASMAWHGQLLRTLRNAVMAGANLVLPRRFQRALDPTTLTQVRMGIAIFAATAACVGRLTLGF